MCGIAGLVTDGAQPDRALLERMTDALARRGPDDRGLYLDETGGCGLGHRRLSIIDLEGGHQPLSDEAGEVHAVVNGELYNFVALREELESKGHVFRTRSDSEVVVHGYKEWGAGLVAKLEGMFAFAVWDVRNRKLLLARDRMGQKPLYFARVGRGLVFGSEAKALFAHPEVSRAPSPRGLASYLTYECVPEGGCLTEGMQKLLPGHLLHFDAVTRAGEPEPYWRHRFAGAPEREELEGLSADALVERLQATVLRAVEARLVADVPLGVLLSGGVDSSLVAAAMSRCASKVKSFSISFEDPSFDESSHAQRVAQHLGLDHHEERLSPEMMIDILPEVAAFMCEPIGDASVIPTYLLSRFTRETVKVALGGDGGDELFLGYPTFAADQVARLGDRFLPLSLQAGLGQAALTAAGWLPVSRRNFSFDFKVKRFAQGLGFEPHERHQAWMGSFLPAELERVLAPDVRAEAMKTSPYAPIQALAAEADPVEPLDAISLQYARFYLAGDVLVKVDRASMACGLEVRAPLLDREVVELSAALPVDMKLRRGVTKFILKAAARPWLPEGIVDRPKKGFGVPIADWIRGPLRGLAEDLLGGDRLRRQGWLDAGEVRRLLDEHFEGQADHRKPLWTLMAFQLWAQNHGPGSQA